MSAQFGVWNLDGCEISTGYLDRVHHFISREQFDAKSVFSHYNFGVAYFPFHTTRESRDETQPHVTQSGLVVTWVGRLDNREELAQAINPGDKGRGDAAIVGSIFEQWGIGSLSKLKGDWAVSIWNPHQQTLLLATDYMGIEGLYYQITERTTVWSSRLHSIVLLSPSQLAIDDEYMAGYLAFYPPAHLTPYKGIHPVPPGCSVLIRKGSVHVYRHWDLASARRLRYKTDSAYEEHFRHLFRQAVHRRLRSDTPILAELSGGLDSSSIVCMADDIIAKGKGQSGPVHTISYYDPDSSTGDERSFIAKVEAKRGRRGLHLRTGQSRPFFSFGNQFGAVPGACSAPSGLRKTVSELMRRQGFRVVLSGLGGDEFLGGVPNPSPLLADLIAQCRPLEFLRQLASWSMVKRRPWFHLVRDTSRLLLPTCVRKSLAAVDGVAPWIAPPFASDYNIDVRQLGPQGSYGFWLPTRRDRAQTLIAMRRQLAYSRAHGERFEERRYPYLDQDLIEFLLSIPASQLLRPGERRSLMRRALVDLVPPEILSRRTKGGAARGAIFVIDANWDELEEVLRSPLSAARGYVLGPQLRESVRAAKSGDAPNLVCLMKTLYLEVWLRALARECCNLPTTSTGDSKDGGQPMSVGASPTGSTGRGS